MSGWMLLVAGALGVIAGATANHCAERWSQSPRGIDPWLCARAGETLATLAGRLPVLGWWLRRTEINATVPGGWLRPLVIELGLAALFVLLAWTPTQTGYLRPLMLVGDELAALGPWPAGVWLRPVDVSFHWAQFLSRAILLTLMLTASLIDFDEKLIPDEITISGAMLGLLLALIWPRTLPVGMATTVNGRAETTFLNLATPNGWPEWLAGAPAVTSLLLAWGCFTLWWLAFPPWYFRRGRSPRKALALTCAWLRREKWLATWITFLALHWLVIGFAWNQGGERWHALGSALFGMVAGGGLIWITRIIATHVLGREALGFGDVTLMAMIGALIGWQACVLVFFVAPIFALTVALAQLFLRREGEIYYGPFLCLSTLWILLRWPDWWAWAEPLFRLWWLVPSALLVCLGLMWLLLIIVRAIKEFAVERFGGEGRR